MASRHGRITILIGVRGQKSADIDGPADTIREATIFPAESPEIRELDLDPVLALSRGASIVDARIVLR